MFVDEKTVGEVPALDTPQKRLAALIREGSKLHGEHRFAWADPDLGLTCAIGAAAVAAGVPIRECLDHSFMYPVLSARIGLAGDAARDLFVATFRQHDSGMSREQVADWLEQQGY